ncbi:hypothetical protein [Aeromonas allosaccharophila]|uniref:hypothetical protein n=1 Tax=Aeromonas allosaccharophila TaxID=656 RepID=UPI000DD07B5C|nr:hypothetical protein [Aeromonas allosaccharophila]
MRWLIPVMTLLLSWSVYAVGINHNFRPLTHLNKLEFYDYTITRFEFDENFIILDFDKVEQKFKDKFVNLVIETNIPEAETGFGYTLHLDSNESVCKRDGVVIQQDFIDVLIDDKPFVKKQITFDSFPAVTDDGYLKNNNVMTLTSQVINHQGLLCLGSVTLLAELSL